MEQREGGDVIWGSMEEVRIDKKANRAKWKKDFHGLVPAVLSYPTFLFSSSQKWNNNHWIYLCVLFRSGLADRETLNHFISKSNRDVKETAECLMEIEVYVAAWVLVNFCLYAQLENSDSQKSVKVKEFWFHKCIVELQYRKVIHIIIFYMDM